ncbi:MAG: hypothetical protein AB7O24_23140 [Kofleriaceae bacterium]
MPELTDPEFVTRPPSGDIGTTYRYEVAVDINNGASGCYPWQIGGYGGDGNNATQ